MQATTKGTTRANTDTKTSATTTLFKRNTGYFHWVYLSVLVLVGLAALFSGARTLYYFFFILLVIRLACGLLLHHATKNMYVRLFSNDTVITTGDTVHLSYRITNGSVLPVAHSHIVFTLDEKLRGVEASRQAHMAFFGPQETLPFKKEFVCLFRGFYSLGQVSIKVYDPLLFSSKTLHYDKAIDVVVYPKVVKLPRSLFAPKAQGGTLKAQERSLEDRTHILNVREYVPGDQLKNIHWKLSAKGDQLMTREFHQTMSSRLQIFVDGFRGHMGAPLTPEREETLVSFCVSFVKMAIDQGLQYSLNLNTAQRQYVQGSRSDDFAHVMDLMTAYNADSGEVFESFLGEQLAHASTFEQYVFITPAMTPGLRHFLDGLQNAYVVYVLACDDEDLSAHHTRRIESLMPGGGRRESD